MSYSWMENRILEEAVETNRLLKKILHHLTRNQYAATIDMPVNNINPNTTDDVIMGGASKEDRQSSLGCKPSP